MEKWAPSESRMSRSWRPTMISIFPAPRTHLRQAGPQLHRLASSGVCDEILSTIVLLSAAPSSKHGTKTQVKLARPQLRMMISSHVWCGWSILQVYSSSLMRGGYWSEPPKSIAAYDNQMRIPFRVKWSLWYAPLKAPRKWIHWFQSDLKLRGHFTLQWSIAKRFEGIVDPRWLSLYPQRKSLSRTIQLSLARNGMNVLPQWSGASRRITVEYIRELISWVLVVVFHWESTVQTEIWLVAKHDLSASERRGESDEHPVCQGLRLHPIVTRTNSAPRARRSAPRWVS